VSATLGDPWLSIPISSSPLKKYSPYDRELLAVYEAIKYFRHLVISTDHKPLTCVFQQRRDKCSLRQFRHLGLIEQFSADFRHISRQDNVVEDGLSRAYSVVTPLDFHALASSQEQDAELQNILENGSALRLERVPIPGTQVNLYCHTSHSTTADIHNHSSQTPGL
jgi:cleavage and polyadenylation specificity factor subunit 1